MLSSTMTIGLGLDQWLGKKNTDVFSITTTKFWIKKKKKSLKIIHVQSLAQTKVKMAVKGLL